MNERIIASCLNAYLYQQSVPPPASQRAQCERTLLLGVPASRGAALLGTGHSGAPLQSPGVSGRTSLKSSCLGTPFLVFTPSLSAHIRGPILTKAVPVTGLWRAPWRGQEDTLS